MVAYWMGFFLLQVSCRSVTNLIVSISLRRTPIYISMRWSSSVPNSCVRSRSNLNEHYWLVCMIYPKSKKIRCRTSPHRNLVCCHWICHDWKGFEQGMNVLKKLYQASLGKFINWDDSIRRAQEAPGAIQWPNQSIVGLFTFHGNNFSIFGIEH